MKFKILKGTELFNKLKALQLKCQNANKAAFDLAGEFGSKEILPSPSINVIAGGLSGMKLDAPPAGWKLASKYHYTTYYPKRTKANKDLIERIEALPKIKTEELNEIIGYNPFNRSEDERRISFCPGVYWHYEDFILVSVAEYVEYTPVADMIEITVSEFNKLRETGKEKRKAA